jgi:hypothetical protein
VAGVIPARRTYGSLSARQGPLAEVGEGVGWRSYPHAPKKLGLDAAFGRGPQMLWTCRYREGPNTSRLGPAPKRYLATPCAGVTGRRSRFLGPEVRNAHNPFCALSDFSASENWLGWVTYVLVAADTNSAGWSDGQAVFGESGPARRGRPDKTAVASCAASPLFSAGQELPFGPPKPTAKVILLRPTLCVAYAGNVGAALSAIRGVASEEVDVATVEGRLLEAHDGAIPSSARDSPFGWCSHNADRPSFSRAVGCIGRP